MTTTEQPNVEIARLAAEALVGKIKEQDSRLESLERTVTELQTRLQCVEESVSSSI